MVDALPFWLVLVCSRRDGWPWLWFIPCHFMYQKFIGQTPKCHRSKKEELSFVRFACFTCFSCFSGFAFAVCCVCSALLCFACVGFACFACSVCFSLLALSGVRTLPALLHSHLHRPQKCSGMHPSCRLQRCLPQREEAHTMAVCY